MLALAWTGCVVVLVVAAVVPSMASHEAALTCGVSILASFLLSYSKASGLVFVKRYVKHALELRTCMYASAR